MRKKQKRHGENPSSKMDMRYTKNKLLQIQVGVNLIRCLEGYSSSEEEEYAQINQEHIQLHKRLWDHVEQLR